MYYNYSFLEPITTLMTVFWKFKTNHSALCIMNIFSVFRTNHNVESSLHRNKMLEYFRLMSSALASKTKTTKNGKSK